MVHFPLNLAEVTLGASPGGKVTLRSYLEEETGELAHQALLPTPPPNLTRQGSLSLPSETIAVARRFQPEGLLAVMAANT